MSALKGTVLVTGGAGFIGSALVWALNRRGITDIVVADHLLPAKSWRATVPLDSNLPEKRRNLQPLKIREQVDADLFRRLSGSV